ncbi:MAG TPA: hypothetical protein VFB07_11770 [Vicinamibacterales bacterium]|nr:hypothetical protein [Vicinamibacterales bacterium]
MRSAAIAALVSAVALLHAQDVEQRAQGARPPAALVAGFDGLGVGFEGPQGTATLRNPSDNSLAVGPQHVVQIVNTRMAIFSKSGAVLYGPAPTNTVFRGFGGTCEERNNGDAVVRYDQLADRWLIVMPIFTRAAPRPDQPAAWTDDGHAHVSPPGRPGQPGPAAALYRPAPIPDVPSPRPTGAAPADGAARQAEGPYAMCYAVSTTADPLGSYFRYEFLRPLFPDYPRPAIWRDGYYVPTSTSDDPISETVTTQKHACVVDRSAMLRGRPAAEQCLVLDNVGFLNNADIDGKAEPPRGAPNVMMAAGGTQLKRILDAHSIDAWQFHVDWTNASNTTVTGPQRIEVAPYRYLCGGQLTNCVPQPGIAQRLDAQGDKIMARLVYRRIGDREAIVAAHSVDTSAGAGGVRWYEFRIDRARRVTLAQQGTYATDADFRWLPSPAIDRRGNIGIGYSYGGADAFVGQRFAARLNGDPPGQLTLHETILARGEAAQNAIRWEDYTQTAMDPSDDCTIWYVGDYLRNGATAYSTKIGAFRLPGCSSSR